LYTCVYVYIHVYTCIYVYIHTHMITNKVSRMPSVLCVENFCEH
jgi:hypothetical protein